MKKKSRDVYTLRANTNEFCCILIFATRYAMGQETYAPVTVCDVMLKALPDLPDGTIDCVLRDLSDNEELAKFNSKAWGDELDRSYWYRLWRQLAKEKARRENARRMEK